MTSTDKRHSGNVMDEMKELAREYEALVREELEKCDNAYLLRQAATKRSQWSGGHGLENMSEQIIRETALGLLQDRDRK